MRKLRDYMRALKAAERELAAAEAVNRVQAAAQLQCQLKTARREAQRAEQ